MSDMKKPRFPSTNAPDAQGGRGEDNHSGCIIRKARVIKVDAQSNAQQVLSLMLTSQQIAHDPNTKRRASSLPLGILLR